MQFVLDTNPGIHEHVPRSHLCLLMVPLKSSHAFSTFSLTDLFSRGLPNTSASIFITGVIIFFTSRAAVPHPGLPTQAAPTRTAVLGPRRAVFVALCSPSAGAHGPERPQRATCRARAGPSRVPSAKPNRNLFAPAKYGSIHPFGKNNNKKKPPQSHFHML